MLERVFALNFRYIGAANPLEELLVRFLMDLEKVATCMRDEKKLNGEVIFLARRSSEQ